MRGAPLVGHDFIPDTVGPNLDLPEEVFDQLARTFRTGL